LDEHLNDIIHFGEVEEGDEENVQRVFMQDLENIEKAKLQKIISGDYAQRAQMEEQFKDQNEAERKKKLERMNAMFEGLEKREGMDSEGEFEDEKKGAEADYAKLLGRIFFWAKSFRDCR
jgi:rubrerythrin